MQQTFTEDYIEYAGASVQMWKGGQGPALLVLHGAGGNPAMMSYHHALAEKFTVYAPSHPGFEKSARPSWLDSVTAVAHFYHGLIDEMGIERYSTVGFSLGGWIAAEMASMREHNQDRMVISAGAGIRPKEGEIAEIFSVSREHVAGLRFYDTSQVPDYLATYGRKPTPEEANQERSNRETAARWSWEPYMYNPNLPRYLAKVKTPTLIVWGKHDAIVPVECAYLYQKAIANSRVVVIDSCGHIPQVEKPREFLDAVIPFLSDA